MGVPTTTLVGVCGCGLDKIKVECDLQPSTDKEEITERYEAVEELFTNEVGNQQQPNPRQPLEGLLGSTSTLVGVCGCGLYKIGVGVRIEARPYQPTRSLPKPNRS